MPFDEEDDDTLEPQPVKTGLKKVSTQKSIFDDMAKKPTQEDLNKKVKQLQEKDSSYKVNFAELAVELSKVMNDKTLRENKNVFSKEIESELLKKLVNLATQVNNDAENEGEGSIGLITLLLKISLLQRDRINSMEYRISLLEKNMAPDKLLPLIRDALDNKKGNE
jgi:ATP-dependent Clp protease adapter protein ClpS